MSVVENHWVPYLAFTCLATISIIIDPTRERFFISIFADEPFVFLVPLLSFR